MNLVPAAAVQPPKTFGIQCCHNKSKCPVSGCTKACRKKSIFDAPYGHYHSIKAAKQTSRRNEHSLTGEEVEGFWGDTV